MNKSSQITMKSIFSETGYVQSPALFKKPYLSGEYRLEPTNPAADLCYLQGGTFTHQDTTIIGTLENEAKYMVS